MSCKHCETVRRQQQELIDAHPGGKYPGMYATHFNDDMTSAVNAARWDPGPESGMRDCRCDCHMPARIGGRLPRLAS